MTTRDKNLLSDQDLHDILQNMIVGVVKVNQDGIITYANEAAKLFLEDPDMVGRFFIREDYGLLNGDGEEVPIAEHPVSLSLKEGKRITNFIQLLNIGNKHKWFSVNSAPAMDDDKVDGAIVNFVEITDEVRAQNQLKESEKKYRLLAENMTDAILLHEKDGSYAYISESIEEILGYKTKEFSALDPSDLFHPDDLKKLEQSHNDVLEGKANTIRYRSKGKNGEYKWLESHVKLVEHQDGKHYVQNTVRDIHEQKMLEDRLRNREHQFSKLLEEAPFIIQIFDKEGTMVETNKAWEKAWGFKKSDAIGWYNVLKDKNLAKCGLQEHVTKGLKGERGGFTNAFYTHKLYPDLKKYFDIRYFPLTNEEGAIENLVVISDDVTEKIQAERKLRDSENKFRSLFESAGHAILIVEPGGQIREANKSATKIFGLPKNDLKKKNALDLTHKDDQEIVRSRFEKLQSGQRKNFVLEIKYINREGQTKWVHLSASSFLDSNDKPMVVLILEDISDKQEYLQKVKASELKFRSIFEETGHGITITDNDGAILSANKRFRQMIGLSKSDIKKGANCLDFMSYNALDEARANFDLLLSHPSESVNTEGKLYNKNGESLWVRLNGSSYKDPVTGEMHMVGIVEDITDRKIAVEKLKASEEFQHETINALHIGLMVMRTNGEIEQVNAAWQSLIKNWHELKNVGTGDNFIEIIKSLSLGDQFLTGIHQVNNEGTELFETEILTGKKSNRWFAIRASKLTAKFDCLVITLQDITIRKKVEKALEESLSSYRNIYNKTPVMMHSIDQHGTLVSVSDFWLEKMGYQRHEVIGRKLSDFLSEDSKKDAKVVMPVFFDRGSIYDVSYKFVTRDGEVLETLLSAIEEGRGMGNSRSLAVVTDITALKKAERDLKKSQSALLEAQSLARVGNYDLNIYTGMFTSSRVFDEILEIEPGDKKHFSILQEIISGEYYREVEKLFTDSFKKEGPFKYSGQVKTLRSRTDVWLEGIGNVIMKDGYPERLVGTIQDVTSGKEAEHEIQKLTERLKMAMQAAGIGVWEEDLNTGQLHWEPEMYELFQLNPESPVKSWGEIEDLIDEEDRHKITGTPERIQKGQDLYYRDYKVHLPDGLHHLRSITREIKNSQNKAVRLVGVVMDVSRDKEILENLEASLAEKDTLLKEVHHRVKNNMQMISSILALKSMELEDPDAKSTFDDCTSRVKSMAMVHDQLYKFYNLSEIEMGEYLHHLIGGLNALLAGSSGDFVLNIDADKYEMDVDEALLCGLMVSEIVANAFKHGFKGHKEGVIDVKFRMYPDKKVLTITNTGNPMPEDVLEIKTSSLGMSLIKTFSTQLGGELRRHEDNGLQITF